MLEGMSGGRAVLARMGTTRLEITSISELQEVVARYASFDAAVVSALRHDATVLWGHGTEAPFPRGTAAPERLH